MTLTITQPVSGGVVAQRGAGANMSVDVTDGVAMIANQAVQVTASNLAIAAADATRDRVDAVVVDDTATLSVITGAYDGQFYPDTTGFCALAWVYVLNQADPNYTGTIVDAYITAVTGDVGYGLTYVPIPEPGFSMGYTWSGIAETDADPGAGIFGFDNTAIGSITTVYISTTSLTNPGDTIQQWLTLGWLSIGSYLIMWSRKDPSYWTIWEITGRSGATSGPGVHSYIGFSVTLINNGQSFSTPALYTDDLDTLMTWGGPLSGSSTPTGTLIKRTVHTSGSAATHTFDAACTTARIIGVGGGGGGGSGAGAVNQTGIGAGGGGGGCFDVLVSLGGATTATYTVGTGGPGGTTGGGGNNGTAGNNTTVVLGATTYTAGGGQGGQFMATGATPVGVSGGAGGTATNGDLNIEGEDGEGSARIGATPWQCFGGKGGDSQYGKGGASNQGNGPAVGVAGNLYGGGGGGGLGVQGSTPHAGGAGVAGVIIIEEYT